MEYTELYDAGFFNLEQNSLILLGFITQKQRFFLFIYLLFFYVHHSMLHNLLGSGNDK